MSAVAIIVASGSSRRMGFDKLAADLAGISVLRRSVDVFVNAPGFGRIIVACPAGRFEALLSGSFSKPVQRVEGGRERPDTVAAALAELAPDDQFVAVHDGARPLVSPAAIESCLAAARDCGAAALSRPVSETIHKADAEGFATELIDRESLHFAETPQIFRSDLLQRAYNHVRERQLAVTDEVSAVRSIGVRARLIPSPSPNLKITTPADLELARALLA